VNVSVNVGGASRRVGSRWRRAAVATLGSLAVLLSSVDAAVAQEPTDPAIASVEKFIAEKKIDTKSLGWKQSLPKPPKLEFGPSTYYWILETNKGEMRFQLLHRVAPMHVSSTIYLTQLGFYDDTPFHRVIQGFMAQGGDPTGTGSSGPGYEYDGEFDKSVRHTERGLLSMANRGPGTDGSQFFITFGPTPHLNDLHTIFGKLRSGKKTVDELEKQGSDSGRTREPLKIVKATIRVEK